MKAIFTIVLIFMVAMGSFAQPKTMTESKDNGILLSENQMFTISKVYPNPAKDIVNIEISTPSTSNIRVSLFNIMGVEVKIWDSFYLPAGGQLINVDLSEFKTGVYILKFTDGNQVISKVVRKV